MSISGERGLLYRYPLNRMTDDWIHYLPTISLTIGNNICPNITEGLNFTTYKQTLMVYQDSHFSGLTKFHDFSSFFSKFPDIYRPQRSCEGYVFTGVCLSTRGGGVCLSEWWDTTLPPPPRDGHCCGLYASYWNAFLFPIIFKVISKLFWFTSTNLPIFIYIDLSSFHDIY